MRDENRKKIIAILEEEGFKVNNFEFNEEMSAVLQVGGNTKMSKEIHGEINIRFMRIL